MSLEHEALAGTARAGEAQSVVTRLRRLARMDTIRAYRRLFLTPEGEPTADALRVLRDLAELAQLGRASLFAAATDAELREREGARRAVLHILSNIDLNGEQLRKLARKIQGD